MRSFDPPLHQCFAFQRYLKLYGKQCSYPFLNKKFKEFSRTFKTTCPIFQGLHSVQKKTLESMSFLVLPQHEQFYPQGLSVFVPFPLEFYLNY